MGNDDFSRETGFGVLYTGIFKLSDQIRAHFGRITGVCIAGITRDYMQIPRFSIKGVKCLDSSQPSHIRIKRK
jgi:hypothetical protein